MFWNLTGFIWRLVFTISLSGVIYGYEISIISGALVSMGEDFKSISVEEKLQTLITIIATVGAILGAVVGAWVNDSYGRMTSLRSADVFYMIGITVTVSAEIPSTIVFGRLLMGLAIGITSITSPMYIAEVCPVNSRGMLIGVYCLFITFGQFLSYIASTTLNQVTGSWRWMFGLSLIIPVSQLFLTYRWLIESPRWKILKGDTIGGQDGMRQIYHGFPDQNEVEREITLLMGAPRDGPDTHTVRYLWNKLLDGLHSKSVKKALSIGIASQAMQQLLGINSIMYYLQEIADGARYLIHDQSISFLIVFSAANIFGTLIGCLMMEKFGRKKILLFSISSTFIAILIYGVLFIPQSSTPKIDYEDSKELFANVTCQPYVSAANPSSWYCATCMKSNCGFCTTKGNEFSTPGMCLAELDEARQLCEGGGKIWYFKGCPNRYALLNVILVGIYMILYSLGLGTIPWVMNTEYYPLRYRALGGGVASIINWTATLFVRLTLSDKMDAQDTLFIGGVISVLFFIYIWYSVKEGNGKSIEEIYKEFFEVQRDLNAEEAPILNQQGNVEDGADPDGQPQDIQQDAIAPPDQEIQLVAMSRDHPGQPNQEIQPAAIIAEHLAQPPIQSHWIQPGGGQA